MTDHSHKLLLSDDEGVPYLEEGAGERRFAGSEREEVEKPEFLADPTADANELDKQRWSIVVPEGARGDRLAALTQRLVRQRANDQGYPVDIIRVPWAATDTHARAANWVRREYPKQYGDSEARRARYLLLLGDLHELSLPVQLAFAVNGFVGRLAFDADQDYEAYVDKLIRLERTPSPAHKARTIYYTVHDGTGATRAGYKRLIAPLFERSRKTNQDKPKQFPGERPQSLGAPRPDPDEFLALARGETPTVMFSMSHGAGPSRRGWRSQADARRLQGGMRFGNEGSITPKEVGSGAFLPGGFWFYFACFGAGTPRHSAYTSWLEQRAPKDLQAVLHGLSKGDGFTSGITKAALRNPDGPLGVIGHVDLAWTHSFDEVLGSGKDAKRISRARQFLRPLATLLKQDRVGAAMLHLKLALDEVNVAINSTYAAASLGRGSFSVKDSEALSNLWMFREDLRQFVLLGDPAASLQLSPPPKLSKAELIAGVFGSHNFGNLGSSSKSKSEPEPEPAGEKMAEKMEAGLIEVLASGAPVAKVASEFGVSEAELRRWTELYREAGRAALAKHVIKRDETSQ